MSYTMGCTGVHCIRIVSRVIKKASTSSAAWLSVSSSSSSFGVAAWRSFAAVLEKKLWICSVVKNSSTLNRRSPLLLHFPCYLFRVSLMARLLTGSKLIPQVLPLD